MIPNNRVILINIIQLTDCTFKFFSRLNIKELQWLSDRLLLSCTVRSSVLKSIWWMPWYREAMKDVTRCDKLWGAVSRL